MIKKTLVFSSIFALVFAANIASANHSWNGYHWARTSNPFPLKLGDNVSSQWDSILGTTSIDWSVSNVLNTEIVAGRANPKNCKASAGRVEVCNSKYGNNGWLGVAQIWVSGKHITQGTVRLNDTYFNTAKYNTTAWRNLVSCQEVGHTLGLDHQDEKFTNPNLGTCMDYTNDPASNQHPNQHDYDQLEIIYAHLDSTTTVLASPPTGNRQVNPKDSSDWGQQIRQDARGQGSLFEKDLGRNQKLFTFVIWAS